MADSDPYDSTISEVYERYPESLPILRRLHALSGKLNAHPMWLAKIIDYESGFDPSKKNLAGSGAVGLIQFMPKTAIALGTTTEELAQMSMEDQFDFVEKYFTKKFLGNGRYKKLITNNSQEKMNAAVFYPKALTNPNVTLTSNEQRLNRDIRNMKDYGRALEARYKRNLVSLQKRKPRDPSQQNELALDSVLEEEPGVASTDLALSDPLIEKRQRLEPELEIAAPDLDYLPISAFFHDSMDVSSVGFPKGEGPNWPPSLSNIGPVSIPSKQDPIASETNQQLASTTSSGQAPLQTLTAPLAPLLAQPPAPAPTMSVGSTDRMTTVSIPDAQRIFSPMRSQGPGSSAGMSDAEMEAAISKEMAPFVNASIEEIDAAFSRRKDLIGMIVYDNLLSSRASPPDSIPRPLESTDKDLTEFARRKEHEWQLAASQNERELAFRGVGSERRPEIFERQAVNPYYADDFKGPTISPLEPHPGVNYSALPYINVMDTERLKEPSLPEPTPFSTAFGATLKELNSLSELTDLVSKEMMIDEFRPDPTYEYRTDPQLRGYELFIHRFSDSKSSEETELRLRLLKIQAERGKDMAESPMGFALGMIGSLALSPENYLIPFAWTRGLLKGAAVGMSVTSLSELPYVLNRQDSDYGYGGSIATVAAGTALGGMFGKFSKDFKVFRNRSNLRSPKFRGEDPGAFSPQDEQASRAFDDFVASEQIMDVMDYDGVPDALPPDRTLADWLVQTSFFNGEQTAKRTGRPAADLEGRQTETTITMGGNTTTFSTAPYARVRPPGDIAPEIIAMQNGSLKQKMDYLRLHYPNDMHLISRLPEGSINDLILGTAENMRFGHGGVGAAGQSLVESYTEELDAATLAPSGLGVKWNGKQWDLTQLPSSPLLRTLNSPLLGVREITRGLVEDGGLIFNEYLRGVTSAKSPVETNFSTRWMGGDQNGPGLLRSIKDTDDLYVDYLDVERGVNRLETNFNVVRQGLSERIDRVPVADRKMTRAQFRKEIGKALKNNDIHDIPQVAGAARKWRKLLDRLKDDAMEQDLFTVAQRGRRDQLLERQRLLREDGEDLTKYDREVLQALETKIDDIRKNGPDLLGAKSYFPRMFLIHKIEANRKLFTEEVVKPYLRKNGGLHGFPLIDEANKLVDRLLHRSDSTSLGPDDLPPLASTRERQWEIPDKDLAGWVEDDVEEVMRYYTRTLGMDIELSKSFGDYAMKTRINDIKDEYRQLINERFPSAPGEPEAPGATLLAKRALADLRDIRAMRDRLRGTYGRPDNPYRAVSRATRITKDLSTLAFMGGVTVSSIPDMVRPIMVEGFTRAFGDGIRPFFNASGREARKMVAEEVLNAAEGGETILSIMASQFADIGDSAGRRFPIERGLGKLVDKMFIVNGLNHWNSWMKEWAGVTISARILSTTEQWAAGTIRKSDRTKLLRSGIDEDTAIVINEMFERYGETVDGVRMPNTALWKGVDEITDAAAEEAVMAFRGAISQDVRRTIVTVGAGDKALWTSTEFGSIVGQFKAYGQAAMTRVLISGMQERDASFFMGAAALIGMGHITNELKQAQHGYDPGNDFSGNLIDAIDRSGLLGFFTDINNSLERMSDYTVGVRPLFGQSPESSMLVSKFGAAAGPGATMYANAVLGLAHVALGDGTDLDAYKLRSVLAFNSVPWAAGLFDAFQEGAISPLMKRGDTPAPLFND